MYYISLTVRRFFITVLLIAPITQSIEVYAQPMDLATLRAKGATAANNGKSLPGAKPVVASNQGNTPVTRPAAGAEDRGMPASLRRPTGRNSQNTRPAGKPLTLSGAQAPRNGARSNRMQRQSGRGEKRNQPGVGQAFRKDRRIVGFGLQQLPGEPDSSPQKGTPPGTLAAAKVAGPKSEGAPASVSIIPASRPAVEPAPKPAKCDVNEATKAQVEAIVTRFCTNNAASLERARLAWQKNELESLGMKVKDASAELEKKLEELKAVRDEIAKLRKQQNEKVVTIFSEMRPDAAAQQLSSMKQADAVGILTAMQPKAASLILNEMLPKQAALLSGSMLANKNGGTPSGTPTQN